MDKKINHLQRIYHEFEHQAALYKENAACQKGCAYCCTDAGSIHITTLEGIVIRETIGKMPRPRQIQLEKTLAKDMRRREKSQRSVCPFLMKNKACMIYAVRPFACRRIYSLKTCNQNQPPVLNRRVMEMGKKTIRDLQLLDDHGYSGHISYILHMLDAPRFLAVYLASEHKPEEVMQFGKTHNIIINHMVTT